VSVDPSVRRYLDGLPVGQRALFERLHDLIVTAHPEAEVTLAYDMPAYLANGRRLSVGAWKHGLSVYGWRKDNDGGFAARHPELATGKGTIRISVAAGAALGDDELRGLLGGALDP
jgi:uncharacterized protein DUF1801